MPELHAHSATARDCGNIDVILEGAAIIAVSVCVNQGIVFGVVMDEAIVVIAHGDFSAICCKLPVILTFEVEG